MGLGIDLAGAGISLPIGTSLADPMQVWASVKLRHYPPVFDATKPRMAGLILGSSPRDHHGAWNAPSDYTQTGTARRRSYQEEAALLRVILPPRAQPSRRCETQAPLSGKPPSCAKCFGPLTASARSGNLIAGDATKNGPFPLRTKNQQKPKTNSLTGEAPYK